MGNPKSLPLTVVSAVVFLALVTIYLGWESIGKLGALFG